MATATIQKSGKLLTVKQAAERLSASPAAVYSWLDNQVLPGVALPGTGKRTNWRVPADALEAFVEEHTIEAK